MSGKRPGIWRFFLLQSSRNDRTIDGLGFFYAIHPFLKALADDEGQLREMAGRHAGYFNANPIMAPYIAGAVMNLETRRKAGEDITAERIERAKSALSSALTARGDYFFDVILLPFALTIGSIFAIYHSYIGPVIFLAIYNLYHLQSRIGGYGAGLFNGEDVWRELARTLFRAQSYLAGCAAFVSGVFGALVFLRAWNFGGPRLVIWGIFAVAGVSLMRLKFNILWTVLAAFAATALFLSSW